MINVIKQPLLPGVKGLYYNRGRWYSPRFGRPLQRDMNESALLVQAALAMNGEGSMGVSPVNPFNPQAHYGEGMNLYQYVGSNPVNRVDPLGLEWGMEDEIDEPN